ncbi:MAG: Maf family protein [Bdellovibrionaceae bacterium]|nr:Maf family protein [Pseudobdellovibrionaceae bacterium]
MHIVLISASPRRKKILENAGLKFDIETVEISEIIDKNLNVAEAVSQIATDKMRAFVASAAFLKYQDFLAVTADTTVAIDGRCLEKPQTEEQAAEFLRLLSGRTHRVYTGVCLYNTKTEVWTHHCEESQVEFRVLTEKEIWDYIQTGSPMDKAGAYGIQDESHNFIKEVRGSVNNVIGFPIEWFWAEYNQML